MIPELLTEAKCSNHVPSNRTLLFSLSLSLSPGRLGHHLAFPEEDQPIKAKDASVQNEDTYDIYDPRNPINKRRREENKRASTRQKRERTRH